MTFENGENQQQDQNNVSTVELASSRKRSRPADDKVDDPAIKLCQSCQEVLIRPPYAVFCLGCSSGCRVCPVCFSKAASNRHCALQYACPCCESSFETWTVAASKHFSCMNNSDKSNSISESDAELDGRKQFSSMLVEPDPKLDAMRFFLRMHESDPERAKNFCAMSCFVSNGETCRVYSEEFHKTCDVLDLSHDQLELIDVIGLNFHWMLIGNDPRSKMKYNVTKLFKYNNESDHV